MSMPACMFLSNLFLQNVQKKVLLVFWKKDFFNIPSYLIHKFQRISSVEVASTLYVCALVYKSCTCIHVFYSDNT